MPRSSGERERSASQDARADAAEARLPEGGHGLEAVVDVVDEADGSRPAACIDAALVDADAPRGGSRPARGPEGRRACSRLRAGCSRERSSRRREPGPRATRSVSRQALDDEAIAGLGRELLAREGVEGLVALLAQREAGSRRTRAALPKWRKSGLLTRTPARPQGWKSS